MSRKRRVGAPPGGYVYWLAEELAGEFSKAYRLKQNRKHHNYFYVRYDKRTMVDCFIVIRTSKRCYRVTYFNDKFRHFQYFSAENYVESAEKMKAIYEVFKSVEGKEKDEE